MLADGKLERLPTVERTVELLTLGTVLIEPTRIVNDGGLTGLRRGAGADLAIRDL